MEKWINGGEKDLSILRRFMDDHDEKDENLVYGLNQGNNQQYQTKKQIIEDESQRLQNIQQQVYNGGRDLQNKEANKEKKTTYTKIVSSMKSLSQNVSLKDWEKNKNQINANLNQINAETRTSWDQLTSLSVCNMIVILSLFVDFWIFFCVLCLLHFHSVFVVFSSVLFLLFLF